MIVVHGWAFCRIEGGSYAQKSSGSGDYTIKHKEYANEE